MFPGTSCRGAFYGWCWLNVPAHSELLTGFYLAVRMTVVVIGDMRMSVFKGLMPVRV
jgi:hypothetical protein